MFLTIKQQTGQKTTEIIIYFEALSAFSAFFALDLSFNHNRASSSGDSVSTSGIIGSSQNISPVRAMSQLTVRARMEPL